MWTVNKFIDHKRTAKPQPTNEPGETGYFCIFVKRNDMQRIPTFDSLMNLLLNAQSHLGGSGSIEEIYEKVAELEDIQKS